MFSQIFVGMGVMAILVLAHKAGEYSGYADGIEVGYDKMAEVMATIGIKIEREEDG